MRCCQREGRVTYLCLSVVHSLGLVLDIGDVRGAVVSRHNGGVFGDVSGLNDGAVNGLILRLGGVHEVCRHHSLGQVFCVYNGLIDGGDQSFSDVGGLDNCTDHCLVLCLSGVHEVGRHHSFRDIFRVYNGLIGGGDLSFGDVGWLDDCADDGAVFGLVLRLSDRDVVVDGGGDIGRDGYSFGHQGLNVLCGAVLGL